MNTGPQAENQLSTAAHPSSILHIYSQLRKPTRQPACYQKMLADEFKPFNLQL